MSEEKSTQRTTLTRIADLEASRYPVGAVRTKLVVLEGPEKGREYPLTKPVVHLGKRQDCDIVLSDPTVSRDHCEIVLQAEGYVLRDLGSTNGTFCDGTRAREIFLQPGMIIRLGKTQMRVQPVSQQAGFLPSDKNQFGRVLGNSMKMKEIFSILEQIAPTDATVIVEGETGTGKEVIARSIHENSHRHEKPFIVVDCSIIAENLIESELFGNEKGSFTSASNTRQGAFEVANGGTVFLDELGELSLTLQPKLLRVLEERSIKRVGSNKPINIDVRIVAATNKDLKAEVSKGKFREDLYFRLSVVKVRMPPLRERKEDIPLLVTHFLSKTATNFPPGVEPRISHEMMSTMIAHYWPGNIRELRNVIERAIYLSKDGQLRIPLFAGGEDMEITKAVDTVELSSVGVDPISGLIGMSFSEAKDKWIELFERRFISELLSRNSGNVSKASRDARMDRKYLKKLMDKYGIS